MVYFKPGGERLLGVLAFFDTDLYPQSTRFGLSYNEINAFHLHRHSLAYCPHNFFFDVINLMNLDVGVREMEFIELSEREEGNEANYIDLIYEQQEQEVKPMNL